MNFCIILVFIPLHLPDQMLLYPHIGPMFLMMARYPVVLHLAAIADIGGAVTVSVPGMWTVLAATGWLNTRIRRLPGPVAEPAATGMLYMTMILMPVLVLLMTVIIFIPIVALALPLVTEIASYPSPLRVLLDLAVLGLVRRGDVCRRLAAAAIGARLLPMGFVHLAPPMVDAMKMIILVKLLEDEAL